MNIKFYKHEKHNRFRIKIGHAWCRLDENDPYIFILSDTKTPADIKEYIEIFPPKNIIKMMLNGDDESIRLVTPMLRYKYKDHLKLI